MKALKIVGAVLMVGLLGVTTLFSGGTSEAAKEEVNLIYYTHPPLRAIYPYNPEEEKAIFDKLSEVVKSKIGVTVTTKIPGAAFDYKEKLPLILAAGEKMDVVRMNDYTYPIREAYREGYIAPLNDLLEKNAPDIWREMGPGGTNAISFFTFKGQIFGVPDGHGNMRTARISLPESLAKKYNIDIYSMNSIKDAEPAFEILKKNEPDRIPCGVRKGLITWGYVEGELGYSRKGVDSSLEYLVTRNDDASNRVFHVFEDAAFQDWLKILHSWMKKGYFPEEAATIKTDQWVAMKNNKKVGFDFHTVDPIITKKLAKVWGEGQWEYYAISKNAGRYLKGTDGGLCVHVKSKHKDKAVQLIDLIKYDAEVSDLLQYGIEGRHYSVVDGMFADTNKESGYFNNVGGAPLVGLFPLGVPKEFRDLQDKALAKAQVRPIEGFLLDREPVKAEIANCAAVYNQYRFPMTMGTADPDKVLPEYIAAMKKAGVDAIISEAQKQIDAWMAANK